MVARTQSHEDCRTLPGLGNHETVPPLWTTAWRSLKTAKTPTVWPGNPTCRYLTAMKSHSHTKSCTQRFPAALFITAENVEEKLWYVHITERYSAVKRNELLTHKQLGSGTTESKRNQSQKAPYVRFHLYDLLECKINSDRDRWVAVRPSGQRQNGTTRGTHEGGSGATPGLTVVHPAPLCTLTVPLVKRTRTRFNP